MQEGVPTQGGGLPQFDLAPLTSEMFWTVASFLALLWLLQQFVLPAIRKILDARIEKINADIRTAEQTRCESEALRAQYAAQLEGLHIEAEKIRRDAERRADAYREQAVREVEAELQRKKQVLREEIGFAKQQALKEIHGVAGEAALAVAEKLMHRHMEGDDISRLLDASIEELQGHKGKTRH